MYNLPHPPIVLIVDDEWYARHNLKTLIQKTYPSFTSIHEAQDVLAAVELIKEIKPDLIFLDIEMPKYSGAELFNFFEKDELNQKVVFTTAFTHYAHVAFDLVVADYLLKPITKENLERSVNKVLKLKAINIAANNTADTKNLLISENQELKIALNTQSGTILILLKDIISLHASGSYTFFLLNKQRRIVASKRLSEFERLEEHKFLRIHRSHMINLEYLVKATKQATVIMEDNQEYPVAPERRAILNHWLSRFKL